LPKERLEKALSATARAADGRIGPPQRLQNRPIKVVDRVHHSIGRHPTEQKRSIPNPQPKTRLWLPGHQVRGALFPEQRRDL